MRGVFFAPFSSAAPWGALWVCPASPFSPGALLGARLVKSAHFRTGPWLEAGLGVVGQMRSGWHEGPGWGERWAGRALEGRLRVPTRSAPTSSPEPCMQVSESHRSWTM